MKKLLSILLFVSFFLGNAQMKPSMVYLKTGETLVGTGQLSGRYFTYKKHHKAKPKKIHLSKIDSVKIRFSKDNIKKYLSFRVKTTGSFEAVQVAFSGKRIQLYRQKELHFYGGDIRMTETIVRNFVKKTSEKDLTEFGAYSPLTNNLKAKVLAFFSDCDLLVKKIKNREFKIRSDIEKIVKFYDQNCQ